MSDTQSPPEQSISAEQVIQFLQQNPSFLVEHPQLLMQLSVPHKTGGAVSLVERQRTLLQAKVQELEAIQTELIDTAGYNQLQFERTRRLVLSLLEAASLDEVASALDSGLCDDFNSDEVCLLLLQEPFKEALAKMRRSRSDVVKVVTHEEAEPVELLFENNVASSGQLPEMQRRFLFGGAEEVASCAIVPLHLGNQTLGLLALGSYDAEYFHSSQGTLLLSYVGEVLSRILMSTLRWKKA